MSFYQQQLALKPDWDEARERMLAWWNFEAVDRVCLGICAPKADPGPLPVVLDRGMTPEEYYLDVDLRLAETEWAVESRVWLGDAFPNESLNLGPGSLALYLGSPPGYSWDTIWFEPWAPAAEGALPEYDVQNPIWVRHQQMLEREAASARGRYYACIPDLVEALDIVASLRGSEELVFDLYDNPAWVHACQERLVDLYFRYYDRCYDICQDEDGGVAFTVFQVWGPGKTAKVQCDIAAMLSPAMFAEFETPYLRRICQGLDYSVYHWDGPTAIPQLDNLLAIPELNAIQWTPGAGANPVWSEEWYPLYRRILDAGKGLLLLGWDAYDPDGMERIVKTFGTQGVYMYTYAPTQQEGERLMAYAEREWR